MNEKTAGLAKARAERSLKKRRAVEDALSELKARNETITFKAVATLAGVGRPYLYNNFREIIEAEREATRSGAATIDGVTVPHRTADESRHIEALLRKKGRQVERGARRCPAGERTIEDGSGEGTWSIRTLSAELDKGEI